MRSWTQTALCCAAALVWLSGCDHSPFDQTQRAMDEAQQKQAAQDYRGAIAFYEKALDGTMKTADAHFRMGLIYDEKLNDPIGAVHHFRRYVEITPNGPHVREAKANLTRIEMTLATSLSNGTLINRAEAMRIKKENEDLRAQIAAIPVPALAKPAPGPLTGTQGGKLAAQEAQRKLPPGTRTYVVAPGDTFASISRKFYKTSAREKDIQDANLNEVPNPRKLKAGTTLIIP